MRRVLASAAAGLVAALLALEVILRLLPVSTATMTGYHVDADILTYPAHHRWTVSTGWDLRNPQQLRGNNLGFASDVDFVPDAGALALIGDSYVEASMLDARHRPAAQLQARLGPRRAVYGMGTPGTALLDYAQRVRFARERLSVRDFVVWLEGGDARQALCGSGNVVSRCLDPRTLQPAIQRRPPPPSRARRRRWQRRRRRRAPRRRAIARSSGPAPWPTRRSTSSSATSRRILTGSCCSSSTASVAERRRDRRWPTPSAAS